MILDYDKKMCNIITAQLVSVTYPQIVGWYQVQQPFRRRLVKGDVSYVENS